jgi:hypothetical protein
MIESAPRSSSAGKDAAVTDELPEKKSEMCFALARQLREMAGTASLKAKQADILRQAEEWERIAKLAAAEEAAG